MYTKPVCHSSLEYILLAGKNGRFIALQTFYYLTLHVEYQPNRLQ